VNHWGGHPSGHTGKILQSSKQTGIKMAKIRVLIADDHRIVRDGLKALFKSDPEIEVIGEAATGQEAIDVAIDLKPDVVVMDVVMPIMNGRVATREILRRLPKIKILVLSSYHDEECVREMVFAGASGYFVKHCGGEDLLKALHTTKKGMTEFSPCITERFRQEKQREHISGKGGSAARQLTLREMETLELIANGFTSKAIASELGISPKTVEKHRQKVMDKLGIHETAGLTRYALQKGILNQDVQGPCKAEQTPN
jgi:DNA-binding NarL/FixJ family response regulator